MSDSSEPLTPEQEQFARVMLQNRILQANGQAYEDLFVAVMTRRHPGFRPVKPQGRIGDQGNDGFIAEEGRYFQVFAPEDPTARSDKAAEKARDDFGKLKVNWESDSVIKHFHFAFNDKYRGAYPSVEHALSELKTAHGLETAEPFLAKDLEAAFWELSTPDKMAVIGVIPRAEYIQEIDYAALTEILQHIVDNQHPIPAEGIPAVPEYDEKIAFNDIEQAAGLLRIGNYQNAAVDKYFDQHGEFTKTDIRNRLAHSYQSARVGDVEDAVADPPPGDRVFFRLLYDVAPEPTKQVQDAAIVLIAYFFEKCDVFEDPSV